MYHTIYHHTNARRNIDHINPNFGAHWRGADLVDCQILRSPGCPAPLSRTTGVKLFLTGATGYSGKSPIRTDTVPDGIFFRGQQASLAYVRAVLSARRRLILCTHSIPRRCQLSMLSTVCGGGVDAAHQQMIDSRILESFICNVKKTLPLTLNLKATVVTFQTGFQGGL